MKFSHVYALLSGQYLLAAVFAKYLLEPQASSTLLLAGVFLSALAVLTIMLESLEN